MYYAEIISSSSIYSR